jgi:hypothetical protein
MHGGGMSIFTTGSKTNVLRSYSGLSRMARFSGFLLLINGIDIFLFGIHNLTETRLTYSTLIAFALAWATEPSHCEAQRKPAQPASAVGK